MTFGGIAMIRTLMKSLWTCACFIIAAGSAAGVGDDYQWLEQPRGDRALEWAREQTRTSSDRLAAMPSHDRIAAQLASVLNVSAPSSSIDLLGLHAVRMLRDSAKPHGLLQVAERRADGSLSQWKTVLDVGALRESEGKPYELQWMDARNSCLPPAYNRCLLRLSPAGADEAELREFDLSSGTFVADGFKVPASRAFAVWLSENQVLVAHTLNGSATTSAGWAASVRLWRRSQPLEAAPVVFAAPTSDAVLELLAVGSGSARRGIALRALDYSTFDISLIDTDGKVSHVDLPQALKPFGLLGTTEHHLIVQLAAPATIDGVVHPAETVLAVDVRSPSPGPSKVSVVYSPKEGEYLSDTFNGLVANKTSISFVVNRRLASRVIVATPEGSRWKLTESLHAPAGTTLRLHGADPVGEELVMQTTGFLTPSRFEIVRHGHKPRLIESEPAVFDASRYVVEIRSARAKDGTTIDYYLLRPRQAKANGATPTLMTGYGAFGMTLTPAYFDFLVGGRALTVWLERGGALALPAIRGGGERGAAWHRAAMREKRLVSYEDFIAVAEDLVQRGFTAPQHLGVFGASNGGLLAATMGTMRPDLFGAIVSDVPLTDMLRYPDMGMGAAWMDEYGDPKIPEYEAVLRRYSPFHNVNPGTVYPPFLITLSTEDNRVGPGHARKLAARLVEVGAKPYLLEDEEGGHGVSDPLSRPSLMAKRMTFLVDTLMRQP